MDLMYIWYAMGMLQCDVLIYKLILSTIYVCVCICACVWIFKSKVNSPNKSKIILLLYFNASDVCITDVYAFTIKSMLIERVVKVYKEDT